MGPVCKIFAYDLNDLNNIAIVIKTAPRVSFFQEMQIKCVNEFLAYLHGRFAFKAGEGAIEYQLLAVFNAFAEMAQRRGEIDPVRFTAAGDMFDDPTRVRRDKFTAKLIAIDSRETLLRDKHTVNHD